MDDIDRILREQYGRTPPATPPPDGWHAIAVRLHGPQSDPRRPWWWILLLLVIGGVVIGVAATYGEHPTEDPAAIAPIRQEVVATRQSGLTRDDVVKAGDRQNEDLPVGTSDSLAPALRSGAALHDRLAAKGDGSSGPPLRNSIENMLPIDPAVRPQSGIGATESTPSPRAADQSQPTSPSSSPSARAQATLPPTRSLRVVPHARLPRPTVRSLSYTPTRVLRRTGILDEIVMAAPTGRKPGRRGRRDRWEFRRTPHYEQPPGSWEVTGRAFAWSMGNFEGLQTGYDSEPGSRPWDNRRFVLPDGTVRRLYTNDRSGWRDYPRAGGASISLLTAGLEVSYRSPKGFRLSVGGVMTRVPPTKLPEIAAVGDKLNRGEFALLQRDLGFDEYWLTVGLQYTINRRRRLRVHVGLQGLGLMYETSGFEEYLVGPDLSEPLFVSRFRATNGNPFSWILPAPQLTFEYQLRRNLSLSAGIGGMSGIGASYSFARRSRNPAPAIFY